MNGTVKIPEAEFERQQSRQPRLVRIDRGTSRASLQQDGQEATSVSLKLDLTDPRNLCQIVQGCGSTADHLGQRPIMEDDIGWNALLSGDRATFVFQLLEKGYVALLHQSSQRIGSPRGDFCAGGLLFHAQLQRRLCLQKRRPLVGQPQATVRVHVDLQQIVHHQLAQDAPPLPLAVFDANAERADLVVAGADNTVVSSTEQHVNDVDGPKTFAGSIDA